MQPRNSRLNSSALRGAVDLAAVKAAGEAAQKAEQARADRARQAAAAEAAGGAPAQAPYELVVDVTEDTFETEVVQRSTEVPVVIDFWAEWCGPCKQLSPVLEGLAEEYAGRFVLAKIDVDANPLISQQFGIQGIPAVMAVVAGQLVPLFQGAESAANVRKVLDQLLLVAEQRFGIVGGAGAPVADGEGPAAAPLRPEDPALAAAHDALDRGDLGGAIQAYKNVLADQPGNTEAKLGLAQAELLSRVEMLDPQAVRADAAADPKDVEAQLRAADLDLVGGHVEDAFGRLVNTVGRTAGEDRDAARVRLLELFEVIGAEDPRVVAARTALARVLF
ncbi:tetratricopeptide repeat protein [Streptomyces sp. NRRL WC-3742]|uniref:tetratricopeptide repeat protein n=1 Tax=Streptomyces sp. NRRL WC-3742 TaxID=1463934 RepID=UPI0004C85E6F|nr:tetratricopeptide repeat protein [Streptomyces sp. NRRL WC-3742]